METAKTASDIDQAILKYLREVIPWQFAKKEIQPEMSLQTELGIDSLGKVAIAFRLEEEFGADLTQFSGGLEEILTVKDLMTVAHQLVETTS
jgi:Phosphopantetheine attachment site.